MKNKSIILSDVDGCLVDWENAFSKWMDEQGFKITLNNHKATYNLGDRYGLDHNEKMVLVRTFNESPSIGNLEPHRDAVKYIAKLNLEHGYRFHAITSMSDNKYAQQLRIRNLEKLFGKVFDEFIFLETGGDKDHVLEAYCDSGLYWIEDKPENCLAGINVGLKGLIMEHGFNMHSNVAPRIKNWQHFYEDYIL